jgi:dTDP-4-amino-4,6-dideoxygalactose transaminase
MINVTETFLPPLDEYVAFLRRIWESKWITNRGELTQELEARLGEYLGIQNLLAVNNGTIALQIAIKSLELTGEIITTPFSYVATVSSLIWEGCQPVFVDIDPEQLTIDPTRIESAITKNTSAILATHVYGNPCDVEAIEQIAEKFKLKVIYDAAHCFGVKYCGESILSWGDISTVSFHATKLFHTAEGGAIVCNDAELASKVFYHHNFGHRGQEEFWGLGVNGKISELNAAMGLAVLPYIDEIVADRKRACLAYDQLINDPRIQRLKLRAGTDWNYSYYPIVLPSERHLLRAKELLNYREIFPRRYFYPSLNKLPYVEQHQMPVADDISRRIMCLPLFAGINDSDIERIGKVIIETL